VLLDKGCRDEHLIVSLSTLERLHTVDGRKSNMTFHRALQLHRLVIGFIRPLVMEVSAVDRQGSLRGGTVVKEYRVGGEVNVRLLCLADVCLL
jgi:hypothetical protein